MQKRFVPIEVYGVTKENRIWYIDLSYMSYSQLTELRDELLGTMSSRYFDRIFNDMVRDLTYKYNNNKQRKRESKHNLMVLRKKRNNYGKGRR